MAAGQVECTVGAGHPGRKAEEILS